MMVSPLRIKILFHYYAIATDYRGGDHSAPAVKEAISDFLRWDLLVPIDTEPEYVDGELLARYAITPRTMQYLNILMSVPLPIDMRVLQ